MRSHQAGIHNNTVERRKAFDENKGKSMEIKE